MQTELYPLIYLAAIVLGIVSAVRAAKGGKATFSQLGLLGAIIAYLGLILTNVEDLNYSLILVLCRDLGLLHLITLLAGRFAKVKTVLMLLVLGLVVVSPFYKNVLTNTFGKAIVVDNYAEILFDIKNAEQIDEVKAALKQYKPTITKAFSPKDSKNAGDLNDYYVLNVAEKYKDKVPQILQALQATNLIDYAEANDLVKLNPPKQETPHQRKPTLKDYNLEFENLWGYEPMGSIDLYEFLKKNKLKPTKKALIAILDTGVDGKHEDLKGNFVSTNSKYNKDAVGHGTHCAGVAAAVSNNKIGIASFAPNNKYIEVTSIKVLGDYGGGTQQAIIAGMIEAADKGAAVISMSLGGRQSQERQKTYDDAVKYATKKGAIVVAAAGNDGGNAKNNVPAGCDGVITVAALDRNLRKASFSNTVNDVTMGIAAPGVDVYSTIPGNGYAPMNGTSMATPYVAGLLGMMKAIEPNLSAEAAYKILHNAGKNTSDEKLTGRLIQPLGALQTVSKMRSAMR